AAVSRQSGDAQTLWCEPLRAPASPNRPAGGRGSGGTGRGAAYTGGNCRGGHQAANRRAGTRKLERRGRPIRTYLASAGEQPPVRRFQEIRVGVGRNSRWQTLSDGGRGNIRDGEVLNTSRKFVADLLEFELVRIKEVSGRPAGKNGIDAGHRAGLFAQRSVDGGRGRGKHRRGCWGLGQPRTAQGRRSALLRFQ